MQVVETKRVYTGSVKCRAWWNGNLVDVYVQGKSIAGGVKAFVLHRENGKLRKTRGWCGQDDQSKIFFVENKNNA